MTRSHTRCGEGKPHCTHHHINTDITAVKPLHTDGFLIGNPSK
jgi:hypothetical protein